MVDKKTAEANKLTSVDQLKDPKIAALFDGTEKVVSIDALHWYNRGVYLP